jgi:asparagine synthase (glutamine-hydrolysing)
MDAKGGTWENVVELLRQPGQPFADTSLFAVDAVSAAMRRHVTVALSGDGGDEAFGGYDLYRQLDPIVRLRRLPIPVWRAAVPATGLASQLRLLRPTLAQRVRDLAGADDATVVQTMFSWIRASEHKRLVRDSGDIAPPKRLFERQWPDASGSALDRLSRHVVEVNVRLILADDFLSKVDTGSMRHGLEVRVPLLDENLVDFGLSLPHTLRANRGTAKLVLRGIAERRLPQGISALPKRGFAVPVDKWVDGAFRSQLRGALLDRSSQLPDYLEPRVYQPWVEAFCAGGSVQGLTRSGLYQRVIMLLALHVALERQPSRGA